MNLSGIKLISAILLIALAVCLSACGESEDDKATPSQTGTQQSASQAQESAAADETAAQAESGKAAEKNNAKAETAEVNFNDL